MIPLQSKENLFKARTAFVSPPTSFKCESSVVTPYNAGCGDFYVFLSLVLLKSERKSKKWNLVLLVRKDSSACSEGGEGTPQSAWGWVDLLPKAEVRL